MESFSNSDETETTTNSYFVSIEPSKQPQSNTLVHRGIIDVDAECRSTQPHAQPQRIPFPAFFQPNTTPSGDSTSSRSNLPDNQEGQEDARSTDLDDNRPEQPDSGSNFDPSMCQIDMALYYIEDTTDDDTSQVERQPFASPVTSSRPAKRQKWLSNQPEANTDNENDVPDSVAAVAMLLRFDNKYVYHVDHSQITSVSHSSHVKKENKADETALPLFLMISFVECSFRIFWVDKSPTEAEPIKPSPNGVLLHTAFILQTYITQIPDLGVESRVFLPPPRIDGSREGLLSTTPDKHSGSTTSRFEPGQGEQNEENDHPNEEEENEDDLQPADEDPTTEHPADVLSAPKKTSFEGNDPWTQVFSCKGGYLAPQRISELKSIASPETSCNFFETLSCADSRLSDTSQDLNSICTIEKNPPAKIDPAATRLSFGGSDPWTQVESCTSQCAKCFAK